MATLKNNQASSRIDPNKTGDLSAAAQAVHAAHATQVAKAAKVEKNTKSADKAAPAAKPTRRSARGSEVAAQEKKEHRAEKRAEKQARKAADGARSGRAGARSGSNQAGDRSTRAKNRSTHDVDTAAERAARMKYASDNRIVRSFYELTTGPSRHIFFIAVALVAAVSIYLPVRDFYIAQRTEMILQEQNAIREKYNKAIAKEVKGYMSEEGVEDAARKDLGMVMPGETTITVEGLDEDGNPIVKQQGEDASGDGTATGEDTEGDAADEASAEAGTDGESTNGEDADVATADTANSADTSGNSSDSSDGNSDGTDEDSGKLKGEDATDKSKTGSSEMTDEQLDNPTTAAEVEAAEKAVFERSPWYWKVLDVFFLFTGENGMAIVSTGE